MKIWLCWLEKHLLHLPCPFCKSLNLCIATELDEGSYVTRSWILAFTYLLPTQVYRLQVEWRCKSAAVL